MDGPVITIAGKQMNFGSDGNVADSATGAALGTWTSVSTQQDNQVRYDLAGVAQPPLTPTYAFDPDTNVLTVQLATGDGTAASTPFAFTGGIEVDDQHHLNYFLVDNTGARTGVNITLYGAISFAQDTNSLTVALTGGGAAQVAGNSDAQVLTAEKNRIASFTGDDLLTFSAETDNIVTGSANALVVPAVINFTGSWDIRDGSLVFISNVQVPAGGPPTVSLAFAGTLKGVTVGFAYFSSPGDTEAAFTITGKHVFNGGSEMTWSTSIGFTGRQFTATVEVTESRQVGTNGLSFTGKLQLTGGAGAAQPALDLALEAQYDFDKHNVLVFKAAVDEGGPTPSYDLMLTGTFQYSQLNLTFSIDHSNSAGAQTLSVAVGIQGDRDSIVKNLALVLDVSETHAAVQLTASLSVRLQLVDGVRVKSAPELKPAKATA